MIRALFARWKRERDDKLRNAGYNYAAGQLLRQGEDALDKLRELANDPFGRNAFDIGIELAISDKLLTTTLLQKGKHDV
jgi:hypothetical protein